MKAFISMLLMFAMSFMHVAYCVNIEDTTYEEIQNKMYLNYELIANDSLELSRKDLAHCAVGLYEYLVKEAAPEIVYSDQIRFSDTKDLDVLRASKLGIMSGYPDGTFRADSWATYEEVVVVLIKTIEVSGYEFESSVSDSENINELGIHTWAQDAFKKALSEAVIEKKGIEKRTLNGTIDRETFFEMIYKILKEDHFVKDP